MEYFRKYLIYLRREENLQLYKLNVSTMMLIASLVGISLGFILDLLLPHNFLVNMIRGIIALLTGISLFSFSYLFTVKRTDQKLLKDRFYQTMRQRFSFRQRVNFSIVVGVFIASFILLGKNESLIFTFKSSIAVFVSIVLIAFCRRRRSEFIKGIYEIPDIRDLEDLKEKKKKAEMRKAKQEIKQSKKKNPFYRKKS